MNAIYYSTQEWDLNTIHKQVMNAVSIHYINYTKTEKMAFKVGKTFKSVKNFFGTPQASALGLISFWAAFVITFLFAAIAINTLTAYLVFGILFLIHTHLTFDAVAALVKEAMARNLFGSIYV